jgi:cytochrome c-type biogenesis protein CcsB
MPANLGLAHLSNAFLVVALLCYSLAVLAFAGDFAFGRRRGTAAGRQARARVPELVGVGAADGSRGEDGAAGGDQPAPDSVARPKPDAGRWVRVALAATTVGLAAHVVGVITRGLAVMGAVVIALGLAQTVIYTAAGPLVPALQSYWLSIHVTAMTVATGTYFVAVVLGVVYLFAARHARRVAAGLPTGSDGIMRRLPEPEVLDRLAYRTVMFAFPVWTFGIIAGAIWADQAWGRYWGWDPTETWAFITWVVYACFLHARATAGWRGWKAQVIQLVGFGCLLFNLVGVSLFVTGLHSYAGLN